MTALRRSIIATLGFSGAFGWPLTLADIHERLVPSPRLGGKPDPRPTFAEILTRLDALIAEGIVSSAMGMYALADGDAQAFTSRVEREKWCVQKWRRMRRYAWWLQGIPYVRALVASGSLALGNTGPDSDWDVLVIAQSGRLYTARTFLLAAARLMHRLRTKRDSVAPDKFCFNHYLTTDSLEINHRSLYVAHALSMLASIHDPEVILQQIRQVNRWTVDWVPATAGGVTARRTVQYSGGLRLLRRLIEHILNSRFGDWLEARLVTWQQARILREPATHERGGRIIANEHALEFHPRSAEIGVLAFYNQVLSRHGLAAHHASDSGLTM